MVGGGSVGAQGGGGERRRACCEMHPGQLQYGGGGRRRWVGRVLAGVQTMPAVERCFHVCRHGGHGVESWQAAGRTHAVCV